MLTARVPTKNPNYIEDTACCHFHLAQKKKKKLSFLGCKTVRQFHRNCSKLHSCEEITYAKYVVKRNYQDRFLGLAPVGQLGKLQQQRLQRKPSNTVYPASCVTHSRQPRFDTQGKTSVRMYRNKSQKKNMQCMQKFNLIYMEFTSNYANFQESVAMKMNT